MTQLIIIPSNGLVKIVKVLSEKNVKNLQHFVLSYTARNSTSGLPVIVSGQKSAFTFELCHEKTCVFCRHNNLHVGQSQTWSETIKSHDMAHL